MDKIVLAHGSGGRRTQELIKNIILKYLHSKELKKLDDSAVLNLKNKKIAFATDSFVVKPIFFKGGDIGKLAISGTVNDLLSQGAIPRFISCGMIIEEGFSLSDFEKILLSISRESRRAEVEVVAGDIKVVEKGKCDGIFINTSGIGEIFIDVGYNRIKEGDKILITGGIGEHEISIQLLRTEEESKLKSDCQSLVFLKEVFKRFKNKIHFMRDPTRGGVAQSLVEIAEKSKFNFHIYEESIPMRREVRVYSEIMGFDPLYLANEGKMLIICESSFSSKILKFLKNFSNLARMIGEVRKGKGEVILKTKIGGMRKILSLSGEQLPRIC